MILEHFSLVKSMNSNTPKGHGMINGYKIEDKGQFVHVYKAGTEIRFWTMAQAVEFCEGN
jgi:hypothetical protein